MLFVFLDSKNHTFIKLLSFNMGLKSNKNNAMLLHGVIERVERHLYGC